MEEPRRRGIQRSRRFVRDFKASRQAGRRDFETLRIIIQHLESREELPAHYRDHDLAGEYLGYRECHVENDWLLVYRISRNDEIVKLHRLGTHAELFARYIPPRR